MSIIIRIYWVSTSQVGKLTSPSKEFRLKCEQKNAGEDTDEE